MDILLISAGIKSMLRAAQTGIDLSAERKLDKAIFLPNIRLPQSTPYQQVSEFLNKVDNIPLRNQAPFNLGWEQTSLSWTYTNAANAQASVAKMLELQSAKLLVNSPAHQKEMLIGGRMIEQWRHDNQPPTAWSRMALTLVDIGVEFIAAHPSVMGADSKGETLIVSFANKLGSLIPNDAEDMGKRHDFENRILSVFVRAGLSVLAEHTSTIIDDEKIASIVNGIIKPVVMQMEGKDLSEAIQYREFINTLMGPSSAAILKLVVDNAQGYLGDKFVDEKALGVVTKAFLNAATDITQEHNIAAVFSKQGLSALLVAGLEVAINQPEVFFDDSKQVNKQKAMENLLSSVATSLSASVNNKLDQKLSTAIAINVIKVVGEHANVLFKLDEKKPWDIIATNLIKDFSTEISSSLQDGSRIVLFNTEQKQRLSTIILTQISQSPAMISVHDKSAQKVLKSAIAIIQQDTNFILSNEEWLNFVALLSKTALSDFERLFNKTIQLEGKQTPLLSAVLIPVIKRIQLFNQNSAQHAWQADNIMHFVNTVVDGLKGNITGLLNKPEIVTDLLNDLLQKIESEPEKWGSKAIKEYLAESMITAITKGVIS